MLMEVDSLVALLAKSLEVYAALQSGRESESEFYRMREGGFEMSPQSVTGENRMSVILEQLLKIAEKNADRTGKIAEMLEEQEDDPRFTFN